MEKMRRLAFVSVVLRGEVTIHLFCSEMRSIRRSQTSDLGQAMQAYITSLADGWIST